MYAERPPAGEVCAAQPKSGCTPGAGLARTVAARKARALSGLMTRPAPRTTPPAVPNGLASRPRNNFSPKNRLLLLSLPAVPNGLPVRPHNNFSQNRLLCLPCPRVEWLDGEARPTDDPAGGAKRLDLVSPQQFFLKTVLRCNFDFVALRNRVTPFGEIVAVAGRGLLMGNRGVLHDARRTLVRDSQVRRWIACRLEFRGRHRAIMTPGRWTELFFLDEATALAAGHRPCAECRHADYRRFQTAWQLAAATSGAGGPDASADAMDAVLQPERRVRPWVKRTYLAEFASLPDGAYVALDGQAWLVWRDSILAWSPTGYTRRAARPSAGRVTVLTPDRKS